MYLMHHSCLMHRTRCNFMRKERVRSPSTAVHRFQFLPLLPALCPAALLALSCICLQMATVMMMVVAVVVMVVILNMRLRHYDS
jgi:hypothetical protein